MNRARALQSYAYYSPRRRAYEVILVQGNGADAAIGRPMVFERRPEAELGFEVLPSLVLERDDAQALMDSLWSVGVRPRDLAQTQGEVEALKSHLADMRSIAFGYVKRAP